MAFGPPLRSQYPDAPRCLCVVGGRACAPEHVTVRTMNFGQAWRSLGGPDVEYRAELPRALFLDLLRAELPAYLDDSRRFPDPASAIDRALAAAGWPPASEVLARPELANAFAEFFAHELLLRWFGDGPPGCRPGFVLNTIGRVEAGGERVITITGTARPTETVVPADDHQDAAV